MQLSPEEWDKKVGELQADHIAAGGFITESEAREIVTQALGPRPQLADSRVYLALDRRAPATATPRSTATEADLPGS